MSVTLPTLTVTDAQGARILDAYKAKYGTTTTAETATAYKRELAQHLRDTVLAYEAQKIDQTNNVTKKAALDAVLADLPDPASVT